MTTFSINMHLQKINKQEEDNMINNYNDLTVGKYLEIRTILRQEGLSELDMQSQIMAILQDKPVEEILEYSLPKYSEYVRQMDFLSEKPVNKADCQRHLNINGKKYDVIRKIEDINAAQYIDYQTYLKQPDPDSKLAEILSIFVIPQGKKYADGYDIAEVINDIKEYLPITVCFNICFFFLKKEINSLQRTAIYLEWMMKIWRKKKAKTKEQEEMLKEAEIQMSILRHFLTSGDGFITLIK